VVSLSALIAVLVFRVPNSHGAAGAAVDWTTYEAEAMSVNGAILGPYYSPNVQGAEASGRRYAQLTATGQYIQFTALAAANALVLRYSVPDTPDGVGADYTISLYKNGSFIGKLPVTSKYSWLYGAYPFSNTPANGSPRNFFDEVRTNGLSIAAGDVIRLQKDATDSASQYAFDLVDLENVPSALAQPPNSLSVMAYGAGGTGATDDTTPLVNCISAAVSAGKSVWLPGGTYKITASINLPSNLILQGAGMWYTTLVGDPALYGTSSRRVTLNGNGNNIQLSDFAIVGKLTYRNDSEPNDGLGGAFGTGSKISRVWVEHTKTGAWIINSQGLVVDGCRFRDTIADGINLSVGMRSCTITNCATRGTGDDCFALWPATYTSQTYTPGLNVITHCTALCPFLANGGAIYGAVSNRIEDCLFQDIPYGSGILFSTTFAVGANTFSGTTIAQRCDLNRCGGYDTGFSWRGAVQLCLDHKSLAGVSLSNLNITNSVSDGLSIIAPGSNTTNGLGTLSSAVMANVSIPNYGLGTSGRHGLWARNDTIGSMTVSNCPIVEYGDDSANFSFNLVTSTIPVTVQSSPAGRSLTVDGTTYTSTQVFNWLAGSSHTIATSSPQSGGAGTQYVWSSWSDSGAQSHTVSPSSSTTYTANFATQYFLTMNAGPGGSVAPASFWTNAGASVNISAVASSDYTFTGWTGTGSGAYTGANSAAVVTINGPITQSAGFVTNVAVTVQPSPAGQSFTVDGTIFTNVQSFSWPPGSPHTIATTTTQSGGAGVQYVWSSWSDGGAISHTVTPTSNATYTAVFTTQYYLVMSSGLGGSVTPASLWVNAGASVDIQATAANDWTFVGWTGSGSGSYSGGNAAATVTLNSPITQTASFVTNVAVTVQSAPTGLTFDVDGATFTNAQSFSWPPGSPHTIATATTQSGGAGVQYVWSSWSDGGGISHTVTPTSNATYTAVFTTQYYLTMNAGPGGSVTPTSLWINAGASVDIQATAANDWTFVGWTGSGSGSYSGGNASATVTINSPITQTASFVTNVAVTVQSVPTGLAFDVDGATFTNAQIFRWPAGSTHTLSTASPQSGGAGVQYVWSSWSDGDALSHEVLPDTNTTYTANFTKQYYLTMNASPGGSVRPDSGWNDAGALVNISATASNSYVFDTWSGAGVGAYSGSSNLVSLAMSGPITQTASFISTDFARRSTLTIAAGPTNITVTYTTTPGFPYHLEATTNLALGAWAPIPGSGTNATGTSAVFTDNNPPTDGPAFYRAVSP
jgi:hypothetical protein